MSTVEKKQRIPLKVFVSSTYEDMKPYRDKVLDVLREMQMIALGMEDFGANSENALTVCLQQIEECDVYILILGFRYGTPHPDTNKSFTELEYERARELGKPVLAFIVSDDAEIKVSLVDKGEAAEKINSFKSIVKSNHTVKFFTMAEELYGYVRQALEYQQKKLEQTTKRTDVLEGQDALAALKTFLLLPNKFAGTEAIVSLIVNSAFSGWMLREQLIRDLGLRVGETIECDTIVPNTDFNDMLHSSLQKIDLFADGSAAEWLIANVPSVNTKITVHVKFVSVTTAVSDEAGVERKYLKAALILVRGIDSTPPSGS